MIVISNHARTQVHHSYERSISASVPKVRCDNIETRRRCLGIIPAFNRNQRLIAYYMQDSLLDVASSAIHRYWWASSPGNSCILTIA